jgi:hypothetical protein
MRGAVFNKVIKPPYVWTRAALGNALFDARYGIDTHGAVELSDLGIAAADRQDYMPAGLHTLRRILPRRDVRCVDVFVDFGSGKGRTVLQAAMQYPFRRVYGVELSPDLHAVAERNLRLVSRRLRCGDVRLVCCDALDFEIPDDVTVASFHNPFGGETFQAVIRRVLDSLDRAPRRLRVIYVNPVEESVLLRTGRFRLVRQLRGWRPGKEWSRSNSTRLYEAT